MSFLNERPAIAAPQIYFGTGAMGSREGLQSWAPGAAPILVPPSDDPGIKLSRARRRRYGDEGIDEGGETVAGKDDTSRL